MENGVKDGSSGLAGDLRKVIGIDEAKVESKLSAFVRSTVEV